MADNESNYYKILGVTKSATKAEIKKNRDILIKKYHPDRLKISEKSRGSMMIQKINDAYNVLNDSKKRAIYDKTIKDNSTNSANNVNKDNTKYTKKDIQSIPDNSDNSDDDSNKDDSSYSSYDSEDEEAALEETMKKMEDMYNAPKPLTKPIKKLVQMVHVTLEQVYTGCTLKQKIKRNVLCKSCAGTTFRDKNMHICKLCNGNKVRVCMIKKGATSFAQQTKLCDGCLGLGRDNYNGSRCANCCGTGFEEGETNITFNLPKGTVDYEQILVPNAGHERLSNNKQIERGVVKLIINIAIHPIFKRHVICNTYPTTQHLAIEMDLNLQEAVCGFNKTFTHINGEQLTVSNRDTVSFYDIRMLEGYGMPIKDTPNFGSLFIKFNLYIDGRIFSDKDRTALLRVLSHSRKTIDQLNPIPKDSKVIEMQKIMDLCLPVLCNEEHMKRDHERYLENALDSDDDTEDDELEEFIQRNRNAPPPTCAQQ